MNPPPQRKILICAHSQDQNLDLHPHETITPYLIPTMLDIIDLESPPEEVTWKDKEGGRDCTKKPMIKAIHVISCGYEDKSDWGTEGSVDQGKSKHLHRFTSSDDLEHLHQIIALKKCVELGLNVAMNSTSQHSLFQGVQIPNGGPILSHLFYADDALFVGDWANTNFSNLSRILRCFHAASGLKVNYHKTKVYGIGVSANEIINCSRTLGCDSAVLPFTYLGVPVGANMTRKKNWRPIIERVTKKLSDWRAKTLSFGGRLSLVKSVLGSIPIYYLSLFRAPCSVIDMLERSRKRFLWGGCENKKPICWVAWKVALAEKDRGGLGIGSLKALNLALIVKWIWRMNRETKAMWRRVIAGIHNIDRKPVNMWGKKHCLVFGITILWF
ncbi:hypothetical protein LXL04_036792 [Taraxacum kok-saghyz]